MCQKILKEIVYNGWFDFFLVETLASGINGAAAGVSVGWPFVVVCIPALNEEKIIARVILKTQRFADKVVVCDDDSVDMTGEIAAKLGAEAVKHERN